jgi:pilus assembly protein Flp/PilA
MNKIWKFIKDEDGLELTEYAVIGAIIVLATVVSIGLLGGKINDAFDALQSKITPTE